MSGQGRACYVVDSCPHETKTDIQTYILIDVGVRVIAKIRIVFSLEMGTEKWNSSYSSVYF